MNAASVLLGLLPVVLFLLALVFLDSYQLVTRRSIAQSLGAGALAALLCFFLNRLAAEVLHVDPVVLTRYLAPLLEESVKAIWVVALVRAEKVGFMVDAAIHGFAVGAGFALVENLYYAHSLGSASVLLWVARGLGTALMHGSATAVVGIVSKVLTDRHASRGLHLFLPGLLIAAIAHSIFNHLVGQPLLSTTFLMVGMPLLVFVVFEVSEKATRDWLGAGLDQDVELLELILSGAIADSHVGTYLDSLRHRFPGQAVADMLCLLQIHLELSLRAKGLMIARAAGLDVPIDADVRANLQELKYLEHSVGKTGRIAMLPLMRTSSRDLWQLYLLRR